MNKLLLLLAALALPLAGRAQQDPGEAAQRDRITEGRARAQAEFLVGEKACYGKFDVNKCLAQAKARRRAVLADLRSQEIALNDLQRKRKAAGHQRASEEHAAQDKPEQAAQRARAAAQQQGKDAQSAQKAAERAAAQASAPARAAERAELTRRKQAQALAARQRRDEEAAANVQEQQRRADEARQRKANLDKRLAENKKPPAQPLPVPP